MTVLRDIDTVILHTPKTGGSSVRWPAIKKYGLRYSCQHCKYEFLPKKYQHFRKVTFVRNPISWYASRYYFDLKRFNTNNIIEPITVALSKNFSLSFQETLPRMLNLTESLKDDETLSILRKRWSFEVTNHYQCWLVSYIDDLEDLNSDFFENKSYYAWLLDITGVHHADGIYRLEDQYEYGMRKEFGNVNLIHKNKNNRPNDKLLYSGKLSEMVREKDKNIFIKYGYSF